MVGESTLEQGTDVAYSITFFPVQTEPFGVFSLINEWYSSEPGAEIMFLPPGRGT